MSRSWAKGSTHHWRRIRQAVLLDNCARNRGWCAVNVGLHCPRHGKPCTGVCEGKATQVHHTKGKQYGDDMRHLVASCGACNRHVGNPGATHPEPTPRSKW